MAINTSGVRHRHTMSAVVSDAMMVLPMKPPSWVKLVMIMVLVAVRSLDGLIQHWLVQANHAVVFGDGVVHAGVGNGQHHRRPAPRTVTVRNERGSTVAQHLLVRRLRKAHTATAARVKSDFDFAPLLAGLYRSSPTADVSICHEEVPQARRGGSYRNYPLFAAERGW